jgi:type IV secretory pathway ATPase VirB11/archaellum biosynthesis ATPase
MSQSSIILKPKKRTGILNQTDIENQLANQNTLNQERHHQKSEQKESNLLEKGFWRIMDENKGVRPFFSHAWVALSPPPRLEILEEYKVNNTEVLIYESENEIESLYHIKPFEYRLPFEQLRLLYYVRTELLKHFPRSLRLTKHLNARAYIRRSAEKIIIRLAKRKGISLGESRFEEIENSKTLAGIVAKYTAGFGVSEVFLEDEHIHDVYIDSPPSLNPVYLTIGGFENNKVRYKCRTNVTLGSEDYDALLSRFRFESGRPFSESMPILEHNLPEFDARITVIGKPLSPEGLAIAIRKHSLEPWTLPKLIAKGMLNPLAAGLISFLIDGKSTILVAGSRGSGKTSLLGAMMLEFPQSQRILTIEDTRELPVSALQKLGYKIQSMVVQSSLGGKGEITADEALRVSLRLGESAIVLGEVRGQEARTLYEAMRAGTAGSSVMGTFHADSASSVYERVTHDMGIPSKSFLATDIVIIAGVTRSGGTYRETKRVKQIAEVLKDSGNDGDFKDLIMYDHNKNEMSTSNVMFDSSGRIHAIARSWGISFEDALKNIQLRALCRETMVYYAMTQGKLGILSPRWVAASNAVFWNLIEHHHGKGDMDYSCIFNEWLEWFDKGAKYD